MRNRHAWPAGLAALAVLAAAAAAGAASAQGRGDAREGHAIATRWCATCHVVDSSQTRGSAAVPTFTEIADRHDDDMAFLGAFLADPHPAMPDMSLTRQEIRDLVAYFASLR